MAHILFVDTEITSSGKIADIGAIKDKKNVFHSKNLTDFSDFARKCEYVIGHNIIAFDSKYIGTYLTKKGFEYIDTLCLSPLLFPEKPYHKLVKDDKLQTEELNNPVNDCQKCMELFYEEVSRFESLPSELRSIYGTILHNTVEFRGFFDYVSWKEARHISDAISGYFKNKICSNARTEDYLKNNPVELAYALAIIGVNDRESLTPPWVHMNYPKVEEVIHVLRGASCGKCLYCQQKFNSRIRLKDFFGFDAFRTYDDEPLQETAVNAAIDGKSLLAVFPTGGGKSLTFQLPALIAGDTEKALTVVISPLQSLMKDQVDNLLNKGFIDAVTINGLLSPVERAQAINSLYNGNASLLYIAPESLRSKTIEKVLLSRTIARFVVDEAHCFSSWGQDFRVDYLYIAEFIKNICEKKGLSSIPVSCFTATAKQKVISDISDYFQENLGIHLELFTSKAARHNLHYKVVRKETPEEKYQYLRSLIMEKNVPTIVYVSSTKLTEDLASKLTLDGLPALPFNGKMQRETKIENQNKFKANEVKIIVATSAFGMGVDKSDVGLVVHYEISNSLENYVQEAGRAGRDEHLEADCYVLFSENDLDKHFIMLNQTKLSMAEIQQVWTAIKNMTKTRSSVSVSALELARRAGWDDEINDIETRIRTAIAALENAKYIERGMNVPHVFATSISVKNVTEARNIMVKSKLFGADEIMDSARIISHLISSKWISNAGNAEAESRVDYIADLLGMDRHRVIHSINLMKEAGILADSQDMMARINKTDTEKKAANVLQDFVKMERYMLDCLVKDAASVDLKEWNDKALKDGITKSSIKKIRSILTFWMEKEYIKKNVVSTSKNFILEPIGSLDVLKKKAEKRIALSQYIVEYLYSKVESDKDEEIIYFSMNELERGYSKSNLFSISETTTIDEIEEALLYLSRISAMTLEGGFLVVYNALQIKRLILENNIRYKKDDYKRLDEFYKLKIQQVHIVGEYANMMVEDYSGALLFVSDYFNLEYDGFIKKYFKGNRKGEIQRNITPGKYNKLFGDLSPIQKQIIDDESKYITVIAGPGSGKTRVLVHKLASLLMLEDVKSEQLLMLTFSRAAATEFKSRLIDLIKTAANYVEIKTFHSYCFDLLGKLGDETEFDKVVDMAVEMIENGEVEQSKITKTVLVIDEAQDMDEKEYRLIKALMARNEDMRVIEVGDDDQNIYEFRGSDSKYLAEFTLENNAKRYEMLENYRSIKRIIDFSNAFASLIQERLKNNPITYIRKDMGNMEIIKHTSENMEEAIAKHILYNQKNDKGSIAVLTETNEDALRLLGVLKHHKIPSRLIQSNDGFNLEDLVEMRYFIQLIDMTSVSPVVLKETWNDAIEKLKNKYQASTTLGLVLEMIHTFEKVNKEYYKSDFTEYVRESSLEDFISAHQEKVLVSTIHKTKGKEFDSVYMMLKNPQIKDDASKRKLYVGFTRAKNNLYIHINNNILNRFMNLSFVNSSYDTFDYPEPEELTIHMSHRDVNLGYFKEKTPNIIVLRAGEELYLHEDTLTANGRQLVKFSKSFTETINSLYEKGYVFQKARIRFIVIWKDKDEDKDYPILLPNIYLTKDKNAVPPVQPEVVIPESKPVSTAPVKETPVSEKSPEPEEPKHDIKPKEDKEKKTSKTPEEYLTGQLKHYRMATATKEDIKAYMVFSDKTMAEIIEKLPVTLDDIKNISGFGELKAAKYGEGIIAVIEKYKEKYNLK